MSNPNSPTPPLAFAEGVQALQILTSQTANFTFDVDELTQALTMAWQDGYVVTTAYDSSTQFQTGVYTYPIPATISAVQGIFYYPCDSDTGQTDPPVEISTNLYQLINGNIQFLQGTQWWIDDSYTLYIKGRYKLQITDSLPDTQTINYVLYLAAERLLNMLLMKKTFVFLTNDTQVAEIVNSLKMFSNYVLVYKGQLLREWEET